MKTLCVVPIRNLNDAFLKSIHTLFSINYTHLFFLLCFDNVRIEDSDYQLYWNKFEKLLFSVDPWLEGKVIMINSIEHNGYILNCNVGIQLAKSSFPPAELFFFGSDHDLWHRDFLNYPLKVFSDQLEVGLVVPQMGNNVDNRISKIVLHNQIKTSLNQFSGKDSGYEIMGVFRLNEFPLFSNVLLPDRLLLSIYKAKHKVCYETSAQIKYLRRKSGVDKFSIKRQRRNLWSEKHRTFYRQFTPWRLQHLFKLFRVYSYHGILKWNNAYNLSWFLWTNFYNFRSVKPIKFWIKKKRDLQKLLYPKKYHN